MVTDGLPPERGCIERVTLSLSWFILFEKNSVVVNKMLHTCHSERNRGIPAAVLVKARSEGFLPLVEATVIEVKKGVRK